MITSNSNKAKNAHFVKGPAGQIQVARDLPVGKKRKTIAIVCHPHPQHGGTMGNKVVTTLAKTFQHMGLQAIRFNFRGVGLSEGEYSHGEGEIEDLLAVIDWVVEDRPDCDIWLAGFSFGAYIAASVAAELPLIKQLVTVAPPVVNFPMNHLPPIKCPWVLVQGEKDDVVDLDEVLMWAATRKPHPIIVRLPEAGHFFHGQLGELKARLEEALKS